MVLEAPDGTVAAYGPDGQKLFESRWDEMAYAGDGLFAVCQGNKIGFADLTGQEIIPCLYELPWETYSLPFEYGLGVVRDGEWEVGVIDLTGRVVIPFAWDSASVMGEFLVAKRGEEDGVCVMNHSGTVLVTLPWDDETTTMAVTDRYLAVVQDGLLTIYDSQGEVVY